MSEGPASVRHVEPVMGTVVQIQVRLEPSPPLPPSPWEHAPRMPVGEAVAEVVRWLQWVDETFSTYRPTSEISRLAAGELRPACCHGHVQYVLGLCDELAAETDGYFDARAGGRLDPSGVVKGWAVEAASAILADRGWPDHLVECGGDIRARRSEGAPGWQVGIAHPFRRDALCAVVELGDGAVASSGVYERGMHILDPHRGAPATDLAAVTVLGPELTRTDAYATAALAMGPAAADWLARLAASGAGGGGAGGAGGAGGGGGYEAMVVDTLGRVTETPGFPCRRLDVAV